MTSEDLKKSKEELEDKKKKNENKTYLNDERMRMARANQSEYQFGITAVFSALAYMLLVLGAIITQCPPVLMPAIILLGSIAAGTAGTAALNALFEIKKRLKAFSNATTDKEKLEEEFKYAIELEKIDSRNQAIQNSIDTLIANQKISTSLVSRYNVNNKNVPIEALREKISEIQSILDQKEKELDIASTQRVLHDKTTIVRQEGMNLLITAMFAVLGGTLAFAYTALPFLLVKNFIHIGFQTLLCFYFGGITGTGVYLVKRGLDILKVFNHFNNQLGDDKLPFLIGNPYEEIETINNTIQEKIREISLTEVELQEQKRILETYIGETPEKELSDSYTKGYVVEDTQALTTQAAPKRLTLSNGEQTH